MKMKEDRVKLIACRKALRAVELLRGRYAKIRMRIVDLHGTSSFFSSYGNQLFFYLYYITPFSRCQYMKLKNYKEKLKNDDNA